VSEALTTSAEAAFFQALQDDLDKTAGDEQGLGPATRLYLGISEQDKGDLFELEDEASTYNDELQSPEEVEDAANAEVEAVPPADQVAETDAIPVDDAEPAPLEAAPVEGEVVDEGMVDEELPPEPPPQPEPKPEPPGRDQFGNLFANRQAHPLVLAEVLRGRYNDSWVKWEPETLWWTIRRDFGRIGELTREKVMALRVALQTAFPWQDWDVFENCAVAWNDHTPIFGAYQPLLPSQAAFAVSILRELHPGLTFDHEISAYLGAVCDEAGMSYAPEEWFPGAQPLLDRKEWLVAFKADVESAWAKISPMSAAQIAKIEFQANPLDIHIGRLIAVREYLATRESIRQKLLAIERPVVPATSEPPAMAL